MTPDEYLVALKAKAAALGSLDEIAPAIRCRAREAGIILAHVHSSGTWSRLINGQQEPHYPHLVEVALLCGMPLPDPPPLEAAKQVREWHSIGDGPPRYGVLLDHPGEVQITPDESAESLTVRPLRHRTRPRTRKRRGSISITRSLWKRLLELKSGHGETWDELLERALRLLKKETQ